MIVSDMPKLQDGYYTVQVLEEYKNGGNFYPVCTTRKVPERALHFNVCSDGFEVAFEPSFLKFMQEEAYNKGCEILLYPRFSF